MPAFPTPRPATNIGRLSAADAQLLIEGVSDYAIFMLDAAGSVVSWNPGAAKMTGYEAEEIVGRHFALLYVPEAQDAGQPEADLNAATERGNVASDGWRQSKDGARFWADSVTTALRADDGSVRGFAVVIKDDTKQREAARLIHETDTRFHHLVDNVTDYAIYMLDPQGKVTTWNVGAQRMKGYSASEIVGLDFSVFFPPEDLRSGKPAAELDLARREGRFEEEGFRLRKDGSRFWASVVLTPIRSGTGELLGFAKVTRDLTARRAAEETQRNLLIEQAARASAEESQRRLRLSEERAREAAEQAEAARQRAEHLNRMKDEFLATVSHELRTPLNAILGWSSLLRSRPADADPAKAIEAIHRNATAQARIIEDILDVSRVITGKLRLDLRALDLVAVVNEAIEVIRPSAAAKGLSIECRFAATRTTSIGDPERLRQVAWNLLSNAVKFTDRGGKVTVSLERTGSSYVLSVGDTGRGIEPEFLPFVFERFKQGDSSTTRRFGGLGLGLALVRHLVELHGGEVTATSAGKGHGALFRVSLPIRAITPSVPQRYEPGAPPTAAASHRNQISSLTSLAGVEVLVVDDDDDARALLEDVFVAAGAAVTTAASAAAGLDALRRLRPQVLVSDIGMPGEDGYSLIRRVRALSADEGGATTAIALSAYTRSEDREKALGAGFTTHLAKPVDPQDLLSAVAQLIGER